MTDLVGDDLVKKVEADKLLVIGYLLTHNRNNAVVTIRETAALGLDRDFVRELLKDGLDEFLKRKNDG